MVVNRKEWRLGKTGSGVAIEPRVLSRVREKGPSMTVPPTRWSKSQRITDTADSAALSRLNCRVRWRGRDTSVGSRKRAQCLFRTSGGGVRHSASRYHNRCSRAPTMLRCMSLELALMLASFRKSQAALMAMVRIRALGNARCINGRCARPLLRDRPGERGF